MSNISTDSKESHPLGRPSLVNRLFSILMPLFWGGMAATYVVIICAHTFWYGEPIAVHCQSISPGRADCVLTYRALLRRSWNRSIDGVEAIQVEARLYSSGEGAQETRYVVVLQAQKREYLIKTYSRPNHPDLELWHHRTSQFSAHPEEGFAIAIDYNPWQPIIISLKLVALVVAYGAIFMVSAPFLLLGMLLMATTLQQLEHLIEGLRPVNYRNLARSACHSAINFLHSNISFQTINLPRIGAIAMAISSSSRRYSRFSPTMLLLTGLTLGSFGMVFWQGLRWVVAVGIGFVYMGAIAAWLRQLNHRKGLVSTQLNSANLLQKDAFLAHLDHLEAQLSGISQTLWRSARQRAEMIQQLADQIAQQETAFIPDLLEALHTVLDLVEQNAQALKAVQQVKTYRYQQLAQEQLYRSQRRLEQMQNQLQALRDQMVLGTLQPSSLPQGAELSTWLQTLVADNEKDLLGE